MTIKRKFKTYVLWRKKPKGWVKEFIISGGNYKRAMSPRKLCNKFVKALVESGEEALALPEGIEPKI